jgi:hypothetical protein
MDVPVTSYKDQNGRFKRQEKEREEERLPGKNEMI